MCKSTIQEEEWITTLTKLNKTIYFIIILRETLYFPESWNNRYFPRIVITLNQQKQFCTPVESFYLWHIINQNGSLSQFKTNSFCSKKYWIRVGGRLLDKKSKHPCTKRVKKLDKHNNIMYIFISKNTSIFKSLDNNLTRLYK